MIKDFQLFEKQLKLFDLEPTDTEIATTLINKHKKGYQKRGVDFFNKKDTASSGDLPPQKYQSLRQAFNHWTKDESYLNDLVKTQLDNRDSLENSTLGLELLYNCQSDLVDYIIKFPELATDEYKKMIEESDNVNTWEIEKEILLKINKDTDWVYNLDDIVEDVEKFEDWLIDKNENKLFQISEHEYYDDLDSAIYHSEYDDKLLIYRSMTLPSNIDDLEDLEETGIGVFWTHDFDSAEAYWSKHNREFVFSAYANVNSIDWEETIEKSLGGLGQEREIKIYDGAELELINVFMKDSIFSVDKEDEEKRLKELFGMDSEPIKTHLKQKYMKMSYINFDPPITVIA